MIESRFINSPAFDRMPYFPIAIGRISGEPTHRVEGTSYPEHTYNLHFVVSGSGSIRSSTDTIKLKSGMGFLCSHNHIQHFGTDPDDSWDVWWIFFSGPGMRPLLGDKALEDPWVFEWNQSDNILQQTMDMWRLAGLQRTTSSPKFTALLLEITLELLLYAPDLHTPKRRSLEDQIRHAAEQIRMHRNKKLTLHEMAGFCGLSTFYFSRKFHEQIGMPPLEYLAIQRVELAKQMLLATSKSIKQIALEVGYSNTSYFIERFRLAEGLTPVQYRERFRN